jgi:hypothetical protein
VIRRLLLLLAGSLAFWLLAALPARLLGGGDTALTWSGTALLLCLLPAAATLAWAHRALEGTPEQQLAVVLGGSGLRLFFVLGTAFLLYEMVPHYQATGFWVWLLVCYLFTLALDLGLMLSGRTAAKTTGMQG